VRSRFSDRSHASIVPFRDAFEGRTLETRKISSRRPSIASATISSAPVYSSAVSMWVSPRSIPARNAATASLPPNFQVPCPITGT